MLALIRKTCSACRRALLAAACSWSLLAGVGAGGSAAAVGAAVSSDPVFKALLIDGRTVSGRLVSLGPGAITLASAEGPRTSCRSTV